jgi:deoxyribose-phosphate aldolase
MGLKLQDIADMIDHSLLRPDLSLSEVEQGCMIAKRYHCISVCCRPSDVRFCAGILKGSSVKVTTVVGFPHGSNITDIKVSEAEKACEDGAVELDMVLNIGRLLSGDYEYVENDIKAVCDKAAEYGAIVKVIFENCYLKEEHKIAACRISERAGAAFVKTSTGFGMPKDDTPAGATIDDIRLMRRECSIAVKIKSAGGVRTLDQLLAVRNAGAVRSGATATISILEEARQRELESRL